MPAVGARLDDAFVFRKTRQNDIEEAAEGQPEERGEDCTDHADQVDQLEFAIDWAFAPGSIR